MSRPQAVRTLARQAHPAGIYAPKYDPYVAAAICVRLAAGESLRSICRADPSMPTEKTVWNWARAHPEFAVLKAGAQAAARRRSLAARDAAMAARQADVTARALALAEIERRKPPPSASRTPPPTGSLGDPAPRASLATPKGGGMGEELRPRRVAWNAGLDGYLLDHMVAWRVLARVQAGWALTEVCREPWAPCVGTFYNWLKRYPALLAEYRLSKSIACEVMVDVARETSPWLGDEAKSMREMRRRERAAERRAAQLAPKRYA